jgi:hypothetical protein
MSSFLNQPPIRTELISAHRSVANTAQQVLTLAPDLHLYLDDMDALAVVRALTAGLGITLVEPTRSTGRAAAAAVQVTR